MCAHVHVGVDCVPILRERSQYVHVYIMTDLLVCMCVYQYSV